MILIDTGPIVAIMDRFDPNHLKCRKRAEGLAAEPLITTLPCFTEAMYFLQKAGAFKVKKGFGKCAQAACSPFIMQLILI